MDKRSSQNKETVDDECVELDDVVESKEIESVYQALPQELCMFTNPSCLLDALFVFLNYCYILLLFPFRTTRDKAFRHTVQTSTVQKVFCGILHVLFLLYWSKKFQKTINEASLLFNNKKTKPDQTKTTDYIVLVLAVAEVSYVIALLYTAWTKALVFQKLANIYHSMAKFEEEDEPVISADVNENAPIHRVVISYGIRLGLILLTKPYVVGIFLCFIYSALGVKDCLDEYDDVYMRNEELTGQDGYLVNSGKELFFIGNTKIPPLLGNILGGIYVGVSLLFYLLINLGNAFYCIIALMLANLGNNFENLLQLPDVTGRQIIGEYQLAKKFVKYINDELGLLTLFVVLSAVPYYANTLPSVLNSEIVIGSRVFIAANLAHYALVLYLTSTLLEQTKKIQLWFGERDAAGIDTNVSEDELRHVIEELREDSVALSAFGFFAVTYPTIGRIMQLLMTYGFIAGEGFGRLANITEELSGVAVAEFADAP